MLQERESDVRLYALGRVSVHPHGLGSAGLVGGTVPVGDLLRHLTLVAVAHEILAAGGRGQTHSALGAGGQTNVVVGVTIGSAAPGCLFTKC